MKVKTVSFSEIRSVKTIDGAEINVNFFNSLIV